MTNWTKRLGVGGFGVLALVALGCDTRKVAVSRIATTDETYTITSPWTTFAQGVDRGPAAKMDVLFMIDNSPSMAPLQAKLSASFGRFMGVLQSLPGGGPDLHIGVVSSDLGAGMFDAEQVPGCTYAGDEGKLQFAPRGACTQTGLADHFISLQTEPRSGALVTNYGTQNLADVFSCIALLGESGCGFEHQLGSVLRALGADGYGPAPAENEGFLRDDAYLAVILVTNEDDCSAPIGSTFFDPASKNLGDPLGPLTSFRCNAFGHRCRKGGRDGAPSMTMAAMYDDCHSAEDGPLVKVSEFVSHLESLKGDPARVFFAAIAGPPSPYVVTLDVMPPNGDPAGAWPQVQHSCTQPDGTYADPGVRLWDAVQPFGNRGVFDSLCGDSLDPALVAIADKFTEPLLPSCVSVPPGSPGCTVVDRWVDGAGERQSARVKSCAEAQDVPPCWRLDDDATCSATMKRLVVERGGAAVPAHLFTAVECTTAIP
jgi:hypothetical protein